MDTSEYDLLSPPPIRGEASFPETPRLLLAASKNPPAPGDDKTYGERKRKQTKVSKPEQVNALPIKTYKDDETDL